LFFRLAALLLLASAVFMSGYSRAKAARGGTIERSAEGRTALVARMSVALPLLVMILTYVFVPAWLEWSRKPFPLEMRVGGFLLGIVALVGARWTLVSIGSNISPTVLTRAGQQLVTEGPYRWIRHPLYASGMLLLIGIGLMSESVLILAWVAIGLLLLLAIVIPREERELTRRFGSGYEHYRMRTGALLPKLPR
jgi:protein-S-isoprenylcysteine O-methyltransferase Ste14